jgi:hypothetical protein
MLLIIIIIIIIITIIDIAVFIVNISEANLLVLFLTKYGY